MATSTVTVAGVQMIALSEIRHDQNVRQGAARRGGRRARAVDRAARAADASGILSTEFGDGGAQSV
jgi:hypothetical protein